MKALACELCGSNQLIKENGHYVCQSCGTQYTVEEAKKLIVEGEVSIDNSKNLENYLKLARRAREDNDIKNGNKYYSLILEQEPDNWEANFFSVYYRSMDCVIANIQSACNAVSNALGTTFNLIMDLETDEEKNDALKLVGVNCAYIATVMQRAALEHYNGIDISISYRYSDEYRSRCAAAKRILITYMGCMEKWTLKNNKMLCQNYTIAAKALLSLPYSKIEDVGNWDAYDPQAAQAYREEEAAKELEWATNSVKYSKEDLRNSLILLGVCTILLIISIWLGGHKPILECFGYYRYGSWAVNEWSMILFVSAVTVEIIVLIITIVRYVNLRKDKAILKDLQ